MAPEDQPWNLFFGHCTHVHMLEHREKRERQELWNTVGSGWVVKVEATGKRAG